MTGSIAFGTDHPDSDIDLIAVTDTPGDLDVFDIDGRMVTIGRKTPEQIDAAFDQPSEAPVAVPTWRAAHILTDPEGLLTRTKYKAGAWRWDAIAAKADQWAAEGLVGLAEEVHKVAGMLAGGNPRAAAANRAILALQLPGLIAAADRILYRTENELWNLVCDTEGPDWTEAWDAATGTAPTDLDTSCRAGLKLYLIAADRLEAVFDEHQRPVVATACRLAANT
nr:nucleotidyltransferase domain-containing protein [Glycomyces sp. L485]